jgi:predicted TIM-barrel fold metal-dependent hydrolase
MSEVKNENAPLSSGGTKFKLINADGHYVEPGDIFTSRLPAKYHDQLPHIESFDEGDAWIGGEYETPMPFGWFSCAGKGPDDMYPWIRWEEVDPGGYDGKARVGVLDADGVDATVLYPGLTFLSIVIERDPVLHLLMAQAYNDWVLEFCSAAPNRLGAVPWIPNRGVDDALAEIERVKDEPGVVGFLMYCYPHGTLEITPEDDAVWEVLQDCGKSVSIHVAMTDTPPHLTPPRSAAMTLPGVGHFYDAPGRMLQFIFSGVLDRFPDLKVNLAEVDCGWMPYFQDQCDDNLLRHSKSVFRDHGLSMKPSEYMKRNFSASFITDPVALETRERIGVHRMMWSNDYPHITSDWPYSWKTINASFANIPEDERHAILCGNAQRVFGFGNGQ